MPQTRAAQPVQIDLARRVTSLSAAKRALLAARLADTDHQAGQPSDNGSLKRLLAYAVLKPGQNATPSDLRRFLDQKLPSYMVPAAVVTLDAMPRTPNGKVDRNALPQPELTNKHDPDTQPAAPTTPTEEVLISIWSQVLGLARVDVSDNFFELGGHSLLATRVVSRIRDTFRTELPLRALFTHATIAELARHIDATRHPHDSQAPPIKPADRNEHLPLSFAQQRLWFLDKFEADRAVYNYSLKIDLSGQLDTPSLERALSHAVHRHESLRTTFASADGQPYQTIAPATDLSLTTIDLRHLSLENARVEADRRIKNLATEPYDLEQGPVFYTTLFGLSGTEHVLLLRMHHIVGDEWSMGVLFRDLTVLYKAHLGGNPSPLPDPPLQYADFAAWQQRSLTDEALGPQWSYWEKQLGGAPAVLELPLDHPRPLVQTFNGAREIVSMPGTLSNALRRLSQQEHATLFMTLLTAFNTLLSRYTGREDIVVGSPIAGRNRSETENLFGFFVNTLVLRSDLSGNPAFCELLRHVRDTTLDAHANQDMPFERLVERLHPQRDMRHSPLFQVMFSIKNTQQYSLEIPGLTAKAQEIDNGVAKFDLAMFIDDQQEALDVWVEYNTDLFDSQTIQRLVGHYRTLLEAVVADPDQPIAELPICTKDERRALLTQWNDTASKETAPQTTTHQLIEQQADRQPDAVAVVFDDQQMTYAQLNTQANQLANYLQALGVQPGSLVGVCMDRSARMLVTLLGVMKSGGAYVPLDPQYPKQRLETILSGAGVQVMLTKQHLLDRLPNHNAQTICLDLQWDHVTTHSRLSPPTQPTGTDPAYVIFTSGSTGKPKGVSIPHSALVNFLLSMAKRPGFTQHDTLLALTTLSFDIAALELYLPLVVGGRVAILSREQADDARTLAKAIDHYNPTVMQATPATWRMLIDTGWAGKDDLRVLCGGEAMPTDLVAPLLERSSELWNMYGPTETTIWSSVERIESDQDPITIGSPIHNTQMHVLDSRMQLLPIGVPGELYIGGNGLAHGYLNRDDLTSERFVTDPFSDNSNARLYNTGDLCRRLPDGRIECLGRADHQVKIRGFRVELGEIETALANCPGVHQCVVVVREQSPTDKQLVAYLVPAPGSDPQISELRRSLEQTLPGYMIPSAFVFLDALPLTPNGKVDRKALPKPDNAKSHLDNTYAPPNTPTQKKLVAIWCELLHRKQIGIHDDYFELGGHSLQAVRLFAKIEAEFGKNLPLATLFEGPTIAQLAELIKDDSEAIRKSRWPLVSLQPQGSKPPFFFVHGMGGDVFFLKALAKHLAPDQPLYGLQAMGRDGKNEPDTDVPTMASRYIQVIRTIAPTGPYFLGGYSLGGLVAFEMAQQLQHAGEPIARLVIFDTGPFPPKGQAKPSRLCLMKHFIRTFPNWVADDLIRTAPSHTLNRLYGKFRTRCKKLSITGNPQTADSTPRIDPKAMFGVRNLPEWRQRFVDLQYQAVRNYEPQPYNGSVWLFRARTQPLSMPSDAAMGWSALANDGVHVEVLPGNHDTMLKEPHVSVLAGRLKTLLLDG